MNTMIDYEKLGEIGAEAAQVKSRTCEDYNATFARAVREAIFADVGEVPSFEKCFDIYFSEWSKVDHATTDDRVNRSVNAVRTACTVPLLKHIAELENKLEHANSFESMLFESGQLNQKMLETLSRIRKLPEKWKQHNFKQEGDWLNQVERCANELAAALEGEKKPLDFARRLERERDEARQELLSKDAQIAALREASETVSKSLPQWGFMAGDKEWQLKLIADDALSSPAPQVVPLAKLQDALREIEELKNQRHILCQDWADDDTKIKEICKRHGIDVDTINDGYFHSHVEAVEKLEAKLQEAEKDAEMLCRHLSDLIEHIDECDERNLLACDNDPHPPSVFSVYADAARKALAAHEARKLSGTTPKPTPAELGQHNNRTHNTSMEPQSAAIRFFREWQCHKRVHAEQITNILPPDNNGNRFIFCGDGDDAPRIEVDLQWIERHKPQPGDYVVIYADGYRSVSPSKAFEDGYTLASESTSEQSLLERIDAINALLATAEADIKAKAAEIDVLNAEIERIRNQTPAAVVETPPGQPPAGDVEGVQQSAEPPASADTGSKDPV